MDRSAKSTTRVISGRQHLLRMDREGKHPISDELIQELTALVASEAKRADAILLIAAALDQKEVLTMSAIAQKMGHTTAAASGLVARLENLGYVTRASGAQDRRKVMVCITSMGSALVRRIREEMMVNLMKLMAHLTPSENKAWLQIYTKIYDFCQAKHSSNNRWEC